MQPMPMTTPQQQQNNLAAMMWQMHGPTESCGDDDATVGASGNAHGHANAQRAR